MTRQSVLVVLGALIIATPITGLPNNWLFGIIITLGVLVLVIGISLERERARAKQSPVDKSV